MVDLKKYNLTDEAIAEAKAIPFETVFAHYGVYMSPQQNGFMGFHCPFHTHKHARSTHSAKLYKRDNKVTCFACQALSASDTIAFVQKIENIGFLEAVGTLLELVGEADKYVRKPGSGGKIQKEPYQLRLLTADEKRVLGFTPAGYFASKNDAKIQHPNHTRIYQGMRLEKPEDTSYEVLSVPVQINGTEDEIVYYIPYDTVSDFDCWRDLMKDPVAYRTMVLGHIFQADQIIHQLRLNGLVVSKEDYSIFDKAAKDFGHYRVMQQMN